MKQLEEQLTTLENQLADNEDSRDCENDRDNEGEEEENI